MESLAPEIHLILLQPKRVSHFGYTQSNVGKWKSTPQTPLFAGTQHISRIALCPCHRPLLWSHCCVQHQHGQLQRCTSCHGLEACKEVALGLPTSTMVLDMKTDLSEFLTIG